MDGELWKICIVWTRTEQDKRHEMDKMEKFGGILFRRVYISSDAENLREG